PGRAASPLPSPFVPLSQRALASLPPQSSTPRIPSIDAQVVAGHERRRIRGKPEYGIRDVRDGPSPPQRMSGFELCLHPLVAAGEALEHIRLDGARAHDVDA